MGLKALKDNHIIFAKLLMANVHPTEAAIQAGFSIMTAKNAALKLRKDPLIQKYISGEGGETTLLEVMEAPKRAISEVVKRAIKQAQDKDLFNQYLTTHKRVIKEAYVIATLDPAMMFDENGEPLHVVDMPDEVRHAISDIVINSKTDTAGNTWTEHKIKFYNKIQAIDLVIKNTEKEKEKIVEMSEAERLEKIKEIQEKIKNYEQ